MGFKVKFWKSIAIYSVITIILFVSIGMDYSQKKEMEEDLINTEGPPPAVGSRGPDFKVTGRDNVILSSDELYTKNSLIVFWEINCSPSINMLQRLDVHFKAQDTDNINIIPINTKDSLEHIEEFFLKEQIDLPIFIDYKKSAKWAFKVNVFPSIYIADEQGTIIYRQTGYSGVIAESIINKINSLGN